MALYAIGDIHGCLKSLETIFENQSFTAEDTIVFLGGYVDRGSDSKGVIDFLLALDKTHNVHFIKGNHEIFMLSARKNFNGLISWLNYGGDKTLDSYGIGDDTNWAGKIPKNHWAFLENCRPYVELGNYCFVHAGLKPGIKLSDQNPEDLFWNLVTTPQKYANDKTVIYGHTARTNGDIHDFGHTLSIDTFAHGGKWLSCLNVETKEFLQANELGQIRTNRKP